MRRFGKRRQDGGADPWGGESGGGALRVQVTSEGIALIGEIDLATRDALVHALELLEQAAVTRRVVIDLSGLTFIDGRGAGLIADAACRLGPARTLVLRGAGQSVRTVIDALSLQTAENVVVES